jgi:hypothetical protein
MIPLQGIFGPGSEWFWAMAQFVVIAVPLFFINSQIKLQRLGNALSSLFALREQWNSEKMGYARKLICENQNPSSNKIGANEGAVLGFFEEIGLYLHSGVFDKRTIWDLYSYWIEYYWLILNPNIKECRKKESDETLFERFESLYLCMSNISRRRGLLVKKSDEQLQKFREGEIQEFNNESESEREYMSDHCCNEMKKHIEAGEVAIRYVPKFQEYGILYLDGGTSFQDMKFCPWCGKKLPDSMRE